MARIFILMVFAFVSVNSFAQAVSGRVTDTKGNGLPGVTLYLKGSYDGTVSDSTGRFEIMTSLTGTQVLVVSTIGFKTMERTIDLPGDKIPNLHITISPDPKTLNEVVITAGTFEAGDKKRGIALSSFEMLSTANSNGDIYLALNTMPGTQIVGEEGALFVRGGEKNETKTFVDGLLVSNPYTSKVPDMPARGRFAPNLFNGVLFSSGGYSAEYGQALSSALILQTETFPEKSSTSVSAFPFGGGLSQTWKGDSSSLFCSLNYYNMKPYNFFVKQKIDWQHEPEEYQSVVMYRKKIGKNGLLKSFGSFTMGELGLKLNDYQSENGDVNLNMTTKDVYINSVYTSPLPSNWSIKSGGSFNYHNEFIRFNSFSVSTYNRVAQFRSTLQKAINNLVIKAGGEFNYQSYTQDYIRKDTSFQTTLDFVSPIIAAFVETEWKISDKLSARTGARFEYSGLLNETSLAPRLSLAFKTSENSQVSMAFGMFTQQPKDDYLKFNSSLHSEKATHYILNYQYSKDKRLLRIEAYAKDYAKLIRYTTLNDPDPLGYNNKGYGYARGFELFLRDKNTLKRGDFWISYTFLDTRKLYQSLQSQQQPGLFSKHSLSVVGKYFSSKLNTQFGITYQYASGRPYQLSVTALQKFTTDYHNVSLNASYLTRLWKNFTVIHFSVSNVLGFNHVFGYHFSKQPDANGKYEAFPITPASKRFYVLGVFVTMDKK